MGLIDEIKDFDKNRLLSVFYFILAIYTLITLFSTAAEVAREKLNLQQEPPNHSCIPFFDNVLDWHAKEENKDSIVLYDYLRGQAIVRVCTNQSAENLTNSITGFDEARAYTPFTHYGCPLSQWRREIEDPFDDGCVRIGDEARKYTCSQILNWDPCDDRCANESISPTPECCNRDRLNCCTGFGFQWDVQNLGGQERPDREGVRYSECKIRFEYLEGLPKCSNVSYVGIFEVPARNLEIFYWCVVAIPLIVLIAQCYMLHLFDPAPPYDDDYYVSFAMRGIPGPIYMAWWYWRAERGEFPKARLRLFTWFACACQDAVEGLAAPLVAIVGCELGRFPVPTALLFLKAIKFLVDAVLYFKDFRREDLQCDVDINDDDYGTPHYNRAKAETLVEL